MQRASGKVNAKAIELILLSPTSLKAKKIYAQMIFIIKLQILIKVYDRRSSATI
jgi:hypothetical protein